MDAPQAKRRPPPLSPGAAVVAASAAVVLAAVAVDVALANEAAEDRVFTAVANAATILILVGVGLFAWRRESSNRFGALLVVAGFGWSLVSFAMSTSSELYSLGRVSAWA
jgi:hypothetical protein